MNVDGSSLSNPDRSRLGAILRDHHGNWVYGVSGFIGIADHTYAELVALLKGLEMVLRLGYNDVVCQTDSKFVLQLL